MPFTVATHNVLAPAYVRPDWYPGVPEHLLDSGRRVPALVRHLEMLNADVLCLQEVEPRVFDTLDRRFSELGYAGEYARKGRDRPDGSAVFFRTGPFALRQALRLEYRDREDGPDDHSGYVALLTVLDRGDRRLGVASVHVRWNPPGTPRERQVGYRQVAELIDT